MGFHKSLTSSIKILTIFCFAYIHTSLHAKTKNINETQIVELVDVIYKDGKKADESSGQFKIGIVSGEKTFKVADVSTKDKSKHSKLKEKKPLSEPSIKNPAVDSRAAKPAESNNKPETKSVEYRRKGNKVCGSEKCFRIVYGEPKEFEQPLGVVIPIRVDVYDEDEKFLYDDRYYGWDMNRDSKIDMLEKINSNGQVVAREYDFNFDGIRDLGR